MSILYEKNAITLPEKKDADADTTKGSVVSTADEIASMDTMLRSAYVSALKRENSERLQAKKFAMRRLSRPGPRLFPAGLYLRKMRRGARVITSLPIQEVRRRPTLIDQYYSINNDRPWPTINLPPILTINQSFTSPYMPLMPHTYS